LSTISREKYAKKPSSGEPDRFLPVYGSVSGIPAASQLRAIRRGSPTGGDRQHLRRTRLEQEGTVVRGDYLAYLGRCREKFNIIFLDPPYAEVFLENALKRITEIDILQSGGIIVTERPLGKDLPFNFEGYERSKDYKYGNTLITLYRKG
jgi:hypothetical protein